MQRPSPLKFIDALTFGGVALLITFSALAVTLWGESDSIMEIIVLSWVVSAAAWGIYGALIYLRWRHLKKFDVMLDYGIMVVRNGYLVSIPELKR
jgi:hypothetical protein